MRINRITEVEILDFEKQIGFELVVNERPDTQDAPRFYVRFEHGEIMRNGILESHCGNGNTIDQAIKKYCEYISNKTMAFNAYEKHRKNIQIPKLIHTKLLGE